MSMQARVAVVTGAARGIGREIALALGRQGRHVAVVDLRDHEAKETAATITAAGGTAVPVAVDVTDPASVKEGLNEVRQKLGSISILVNNAGGGVITATDHHTEQTIRRTIDNNLWTTLNSTLAVLPPMLAAGYGRVVNIGAESVRNGLNGHAIYNAAKGGVHAFAVGLAREYATSGITFNTVAPSYVLTPEIQAGLAEGTLPEEFRSITDIAISLIPMRRPATVDEVAAAVLFLASEEASFITGQVLSVNGGSSMG